MGAREEVSDLPAEPVARVRATLERILAELGLDAEVEIEEDEEEIRAVASGEDLGLLIGRHGQTIDAVQLLCFQIAFRDRSERKRVAVDAEGYRERRRVTLERKAEQAAERARSVGEPVTMEPMGAAERRVVHECLREQPGVETWSEGAEPERRLVVAPLTTG